MPTRMTDGELLALWDAADADASIDGETTVGSIVAFARAIEAATERRVRRECADICERVMQESVTHSELERATTCRNLILAAAIESGGEHE